MTLTCCCATTVLFILSYTEGLNGNLRKHNEYPSDLKCSVCVCVDVPMLQWLFEHQGMALPYISSAHLALRALLVMKFAMWRYNNKIFSRIPKDTVFLYNLHERTFSIPAFEEVWTSSFFSSPPSPPPKYSGSSRQIMQCSVLQTRSPKPSQSPQPNLGDQTEHLSEASADSLEAMSEGDSPTPFSRGSRTRASLPVVRSTNQTKERSLGKPSFSPSALYFELMLSFLYLK